MLLLRVKAIVIDYGRKEGRKRFGIQWCTSMHILFVTRYNSIRVYGGTLRIP